MWDKLSLKSRNEYKRMILAYASLTDLFAQKSSGKETIQSPIINSKYQERIFQKVFHASGEDYGNTSYDAAVKLVDEEGIERKYLVGIKTFGIGSGDQKIAQFKKNNTEWAEALALINNNSKNIDGSLKTVKQINAVNKDNYRKMALEIARLRNLRIDSSIANIQGFSIVEGADEVEQVYHVLMPSEKGDAPKIFVGEISYNKIDIDSIEVLGCTTAKNPTNFYFKDCYHKYKFTAADNQLYMTFNNKDIVIETWDVKYADDAYGFFSDITDKVYGKIDEEIAKNILETEVPDRKIVESYSWYMPVERYSGFNSFNGSSKVSRKDRPKRIEKLLYKFKSVFTNKESSSLRSMLNRCLLEERDKYERELLRNKILEEVDSTNNLELKNEIRSLICRPVDEMYIPIPYAQTFHKNHPNFFGPNIKFKSSDSTVLDIKKEERSFDLVFEPSGDIMRCFIAQSSGKGIESCNKQSILGQWLKKYVFHIGEYEPLTNDRLEELGINGMRLFKYEDSPLVHLQFIYLDQEDLPSDFIGKKPKK